MAAVSCVAVAVSVSAGGVEDSSQQGQTREATIWYLCGAIACLLCCLSVLWSYRRTPPMQKLPPTGLLWYRAVCDMGYAIGCAYPALVSDHDISKNSDCAVQAAVLNFFMLSSYGWWLCMSVDLLLAIRNPFTNPAENIPFYHWFVWTISGVSTVIMLATGHTGRNKFEFCWFDDDAAAVLMFWGLLGAGFCFTMITLVWVRCVASGTHHVRQVAIVQGQWFCAGVGVYWLFLCTITFLSLADEGTRYLVAQMTAGIVLRGVVNVFLWHKALHLSRTRASRQTADEEEGEEMAQTPRQATARQPSTAPDSLELADDTAVPANLSAPWLRDSTLGGASSATVSAPTDPDGEAALKSMLRKDIMEACQQGIEEMARLGAEEALGRPSDEGDGVLRLSKDDFSFVRVRDFERVNCKDKFQFVDFAPLVFHSLRIANGIDCGLYRAIFAGLCGDVMTEKFSDGGRSGSFFYFASDRTFIVKTVTVEERGVLLNMLSDYYTHLINHRDSLIVRFYGLHGLTMHRGSRQFDFVVMDNVLLTGRQIHQVYDIKGSWVARGPTTREDKAEQPSSIRDLFTLNPKTGKKGAGGGVLKDLDLVQTKRIVVGSEIRRRLLEQVRADCQFFQDHQIMDYSLLIGCHQDDFDQVRKERPELTIDLQAHSSPPASARGRTSSAAAGAMGYLPPKLEGKLQDLAARVPTDGYALSPSQFRSNLSLAALPVTFSGAPLSGLQGRPREGSGFPGVSPISEGVLRHRLGSITNGSTGQAPPEVELSVADEVTEVGRPISDKRPVPFYKEHGGGVHSACMEADEYTGDAMYFLGIIDILQAWTLTKRMERMCKIALGRDGKGISAIEPSAYAERFIRRCEEVFV